LRRKCPDSSYSGEEHASTYFRDAALLRRGRYRDDHAQPAREAQRLHVDDDARIDRRVRCDRRGRRGPGRDRHRDRAARSAPAPTWAPAARPSTTTRAAPKRPASSSRAACTATAAAASPCGSSIASSPSSPPSTARGRHRRDDALADGHPPGVGRRADRLRLQPARHHARGRVGLVSSAPRRHLDRARVVLFRPHLSGRRSKGARPRAHAIPARTNF
jgi:hypothetical protein